MNILITGGAGFIGSNLVHYLLNSSDHSVVNLDALTYAGNLENLKDIERHPHYTFVKGDILDTVLVRSLITKHRIEAIIHAAAESHVDRSIMSSREFLQTNILGTQSLLDTARDANIKKFVQVSTDEVYGTLGATGKFTEKTPLAPNSPYSASKAGADLLVRSYVETFALPAVITRCTNNYGPYHFPEKLIPLVITNAIENKTIPVYGDGKQVRDWIAVIDHCKGIVAALERGSSGEIYNFGGDSERTNLDVVKMILKILDKPESLIQFVKDRPGHDRRYAIDYTKASKELAWSPNEVFEKYLEQTITWYLSNEDWWKRVKSGVYQEYYNKQYLAAQA